MGFYIPVTVSKQSIKPAKLGKIFWLKLLFCKMARQPKAGSFYETLYLYLVSTEKGLTIHFNPFFYFVNQAKSLPTGQI